MRGMTGRNNLAIPLFLQEGSYMIRLIATDIDGTLLADGETYPDPAYGQVIERLLADGKYFCLASGRQYASQCRLFEPFKDRICCITENGARVICKQIELFGSVMTKEDSEELVRDARKLGEAAECMYCTRDVAYFTPHDSRILRKMRDRYMFSCQVVDDLEALADPCIKFSIGIHEAIEKPMREWFIPKWEKTHDVTRGGNFISVMAGSVNKGSALKRLQEYLGVSPEETLVFGDNRNDLEMMQQAHWSVAVANARKELKEAASFVTDSNNDQGVLKVLKRLIDKEYEGIV